MWPGEEHEVDDHGQDEVRGRAGEHDHEALPQRTAREAAPGVGALPFVVAGPSIAEDPHVAAEREHAIWYSVSPSLTRTSGPPVAEREPQDLDVEQLGRDEVPELVDDHEHADEQEEVQDRHGNRTPTL